MKELKHIHILVKARVANPKALDIDELHAWVENIVREQGLEPVAGPFVTYVGDPGNEGPTGGVHIKTSHMAFHIWDNLGVIQADLYTCGYLDEELFLNNFYVFDPITVEYLIMDREDGFKVLAADSYTYMREVYDA